jgi:cardiolipin synthase
MLPVGIIGWVGLWAAGLLTLKTGFDYTRAGLAHIRQMDAP